MINKQTVDDAATARGRCLKALANGGVVVIPTETLYALSADARNNEACKRILRIKGRPPGKPLPVMIGDSRQLSQVVSVVHEDVRRLAKLFWPGPLSIVLPAATSLSGCVADEAGCVSVRVTSHPTAARLSLDLAAALVATSANVSGHAPTAVPRELNPNIVRRVDAVCDSPPYPAGGLASTVVRPEGDGRLLLLRKGATAEEDLRSAGFIVGPSRPRPAPDDGGVVK